MLSRVADSLYWMSRYLERAEHTARTLTVQERLDIEASVEEIGSSWRRVLTGLAVKTAADDELDSQALFRSLARGRTNANSIRYCVSMARHNARQVREQISSEMWEQLNRQYLALRGSRGDPGNGDAGQDFFTDAVESSLLFQGITDATMSHGEGWQFVQLGRFIERTQLISALLAAHFTGPSIHAFKANATQNEIDLINLLKMCGAFEAYCKVHTAAINDTRVADFLIFDAEFPRSIRYAANRVEQTLRRFAPGSRTGRHAGRAQRIAGRLRANLDYSQLEDVSARGIHSYLIDVHAQAAEIHDSIYETYMNYPVDAYLAS